MNKPRITNTHGCEQIMEAAQVSAGLCHSCAAVCLLCSAIAYSIFVCVWFFVCFTLYILSKVYKTQLDLRTNPTYKVSPGMELVHKSENYCP